MNGPAKEDEAERDGPKGAEKPEEVIAPAVPQPGAFVGEESSSALGWTRRNELLHALSGSRRSCGIGKR